MHEESGGECTRMHEESGGECTRMHVENSLDSPTFVEKHRRRKPQERFSAGWRRPCNLSGKRKKSSQASFAP